MNIKLQTVSGKSLHPIGIGTWGFGGAWEADYDNDDEAIAAIRYSIKQGQNHIDSGQIYGAGHTDEVIGKAIAGVKREDLFITDKVWETHVGKGKVRIAVKEILKKLGTDYLDILYIHKPWDNFPWIEAVPQINDLIDKGVVRYFGVSNFKVEHMEEALKVSKHPIVANQLHYNILYKNEVTEEMITFCKKNRIQIIAYKPLERGEVLKNKAVQAIAKKHKASTVKVALAWLAQQDMLAIPKAESKKLIDQNIAALGIKLTTEDVERLNNL